MRDCLDEKLASALYDVPIPEGLAQRLLERLARETPRNEELALPRYSFLAPVFAHRRLFAGGAALALAAGLLIAVWLGLYQQDVLSEQFVLNEAIQTFDAGTSQPGRLIAERPAPADYPMSSAVLQVRGTTWRSLEGFLGRQGVVYEMPRAGGTNVALFVVDAESLEGLGTEPAIHPFTTAGCCASAWVENGLLYVLVVQGDSATYRAYLNLPRGPVA